LQNKQITKSHKINRGFLLQRKKKEARRRLDGLSSFLIVTCLLFPSRPHPLPACDKRDQYKCNRRPRKGSVISADADGEKCNAKNKKYCGYIAAVHFHHYLTFTSLKSSNEPLNNVDGLFLRAKGTHAKRTLIIFLLNQRIQCLN